MRQDDPPKLLDREVLHEVGRVDLIHRSVVEWQAADVTDDIDTIQLPTVDVYESVAWNVTAAEIEAQHLIHLDGGEVDFSRLDLFDATAS